MASKKKTCGGAGGIVGAIVPPKRTVDNFPLMTYISKNLTVTDDDEEYPLQDEDTLKAENDRRVEELMKEAETRSSEDHSGVTSLSSDSERKKALEFLHSLELAKNKKDDWKVPQPTSTKQGFLHALKRDEKEDDYFSGTRKVKQPKDRKRTRSVSEVVVLDNGQLIPKNTPNQPLPIELKLPTRPKTPRVPSVGLPFTPASPPSNFDNPWLQRSGSALFSNIQSSTLVAHGVAFSEDEAMARAIAESLRTAKLEQERMVNLKYLNCNQIDPLPQPRFDDKPSNDKSFARSSPNSVESMWDDEDDGEKKSNAPSKITFNKEDHNGQWRPQDKECSEYGRAVPAFKGLSADDDNNNSWDQNDLKNDRKSLDQRPKYNDSAQRFKYRNVSEVPFTSDKTTSPKQERLASNQDVHSSPLIKNLKPAPSPQQMSTSAMVTESSPSKKIQTSPPDDKNALHHDTSKENGMAWSLADCEADAEAEGTGESQSGTGPEVSFLEQQQRYQQEQEKLLLQLQEKDKQLLERQEQQNKILLMQEEERHKQQLQLQAQEHEKQLLQLQVQEQQKQLFQMQMLEQQKQLLQLQEQEQQKQLIQQLQMQEQQKQFMQLQKQEHQQFQQPALNPLLSTMNPLGPAGISGIPDITPDVASNMMASQMHMYQMLLMQQTLGCAPPILPTDQNKAGVNFQPGNTPTNVNEQNQGFSGLPTGNSFPMGMPGLPVVPDPSGLAGLLNGVPGFSNTGLAGLPKASFLGQPNSLPGFPNISPNGLPVFPDGPCIPSGFQNSMPSSPATQQLQTNVSVGNQNSALSSGIVNCNSFSGLAGSLAQPGNVPLVGGKGRGRLARALNLNLAD